MDEVEFFPGTTTKIKDASPVGSDAAEDDFADTQGWDVRSRTYNVKGTPTEFFPISALARALRRSPTTIRKWETKGWLPKALYRSPGPPSKQDRLYTREQVAGLQRIAVEENLMDPRARRRVEDTQFVTKAATLFAGGAVRG